MKQLRRIISISALVLVAMPAVVIAQTSSSPNYRVDQTIFGTGGETDLTSNSFSARATVGELGIGELNSTNFRAFAGFNTTDEPYIEFVVTGNNIDLGYLDINQTSTAQGQFYVRAWQAGGYSVTTDADPPTNATNGYQFETPAQPSASSAGTEQFGINLVENTSPAVGLNPVQSPDGTFSFGQVAADYAQANAFLYTKGDAIAFSQESTSVTFFTVSYIFNISNTTPSGQYDFSHVLVATGRY
ncbi:hypothetical protein BH23PAT2_BH23PAT2_01040 [soil metagenome]